MKLAMELAAKGAGSVSPNPMVGAVIVKNNKIIAQGYHQIYGGPHAEVIAITNASESVKGATIYCNLEPCCHMDKQTPPCAQRLIEEGIKKVVIANLDPNPKVNGGGINLLRNAGIEVVSGMMAEQGKELNRFYMKFTSKKLPYITLKIAQTVDGCIAKTKNQPSMVTGKESQRHVHRLRSIYDASIIGGNTLRVDNSLLNVRHSKGLDPFRIILSTELNFDPELNIFKLEPKENTWILSSESNKSKAKELTVRTGCQVFLLPSDDKKRLSINTVLDFLAGQKITSVLVEGGAEIFSQFIYEAYIDELNILIAPKIWGSQLRSFLPSDEERSIKFNLHSSALLGEDILLIYRSINN